ncbi:MAG: rhodanese-like domain-containing protein [Polyangiaceae bacterium]
MSDLKRVSPEEAQALMTNDGYTYVDVRTDAEFAAGHPKGAHNIPFMLAGATGMTKNPDFLAVMKAVYPLEARLVIGCKSGGRSLKAAGELIAAGYTSVVDQRAGFDGARNSFGKVTEEGWSQRGLPVESGGAAKT